MSDALDTGGNSLCIQRQTTAEHCSTPAVQPTTAARGMGLSCPREADFRTFNTDRTLLLYIPSDMQQPTPGMMYLQTEPGDLGPRYVLVQSGCTI